MELTAAADVIVPEKGVALWIQSISWTGGTTAGHECVISDGDGKVIFRAIIQVANDDRRQNYDGLSEGSLRAKEGIVITTLGSGVVTVTLK